MSKRHFLSGGLLLAMVALTGCPYAVIERTPPHPNQSSVLGELENERLVYNLRGTIDSYLLFGCVPFLTGNANRPNSETYDKFCNYATESTMRNMLTSYGERMLGGDRVVIHRIDRHSSGWWSLWLLWHRVVTADAEVWVEEKR